jgi:SAM-dependent methyltransferase
MTARGWKALRRILSATGLLGPARRVRELAEVRRFRDRNARYRGGAPDGLPLPSPGLILRVAGTPDIEWFLESGAAGFRSLRDALSEQGTDVARLRSVLDFGCGCGRVTRHWAGVGPRVWGCDYNPALVSWCRTHLGFARFEVNALGPPLPFADASFDLVYALSVFTHLTEDLQTAWMAELHRVLEPGGLLAVTVHGARYAGELSPEERRRFQEGELVVRRVESAGTNLCGAYHPEEYVRRRLARDFAVVAYLPEGARGNPHQDLVLLRR